MVLFAHDGNTVKISTESSTRILWLSAQPILEPVVQYGPFVMNTKQEIVEAMEQFHAGAFGRLED
jgi:redox-sensitive bicupin YhaK (pirin superfamily)